MTSVPDINTIREAYAQLPPYPDKVLSPDESIKFCIDNGFTIAHFVYWWIKHWRMFRPDSADYMKELETGLLNEDDSWRIAWVFLHKTIEYPNTKMVDFIKETKTTPQRLWKHIYSSTFNTQEARKLYNELVTERKARQQENSIIQGREKRKRGDDEEIACLNGTSIFKRSRSDESVAGRPKSEYYRCTPSGKEKPCCSHGKIGKTCQICSACQLHMNPITKTFTVPLKFCFECFKDSKAHKENFTLIGPDTISVISKGQTVHWQRDRNGRRKKVKQ